MQNDLINDKYAKIWNSYAIKQSSPAIVWLSASVFPHWGERKLINVSFTCVNGNFKFPIHKKSQALVEKKIPLQVKLLSSYIMFQFYLSGQMCQSICFVMNLKRTPQKNFKGFKFLGWYTNLKFVGITYFCWFVLLLRLLLASLCSFATNPDVSTNL